MKTSACIALLLLLTIVTPALTGGGDDTIHVDNPSNSLVFGYIDMSDAPTKVSGAWLQQVAPPTDKPYWSMGVEKGLFYNTFIQPGSYQLSKFSGSGFAAGAHEYHFSRQGRSETAVRIEVPGIYYLGSYKYVKARKGGMFKRAKFSIEPIDDPGEAELLRRLLDETMRVQKSKDYKGPRKIKISETSWGEKIRLRLAELG